MAVIHWIFTATEPKMMNTTFQTHITINQRNYVNIYQNCTKLMRNARVKADISQSANINFTCDSEDAQVN